MLLRPDEAHIWYVQLDTISAPKLAHSYHELLNTDEQQRHARFRFEHDRKAYLIAHALLRTTLARYAAVDPRALRFKTNPYGRPELDCRENTLPLRFNLSHTRGLVVCGIALDRTIGVDVECVDRRVDARAIAERHFTPAEVAALRVLPDAAYQSRFIEYWTLKEAYIKARGEGLSLPLDRFNFHLEPDWPPQLTIDASIKDDPGRWQFMQYWPTSEHCLAVAVRRDTGKTVTMTLYECLPLKWHKRRQA